MKISPRNKLYGMRRCGGFTLIEMMVVIIIIGILVSTVVLSIRTDDIEEHMEIEMRRILALINLAREESVLQGQEYALTVKEASYLFEVFEEDAWLPITDDKVFRERAVLQGTELALVVDTQEIRLATEAEDEENSATPPRVYILSSGEIMPFELILRTADRAVQFRIRAGEDGEVKLLLPGSELG